MAESEYTISELEELSGVSRRNIHFYVQQGLLPAPDGAGLAARYGDEHLTRLRAIPALRSRGLRLDEIRSQLAGLNAQAVDALLHRPIEPTPIRLPPGSVSPAGQPLTRYHLAPGIELLVDGSTGLDPSQLDELQRLARRILGNGQPVIYSNGGKS